MIVWVSLHSSSHHYNYVITTNGTFQLDRTQGGPDVPEVPMLTDHLAVFTGRLMTHFKTRIVTGEVVPEFNSTLYIRQSAR